MPRATLHQPRPGLPRPPRRLAGAAAVWRARAGALLAPLALVLALLSAAAGPATAQEQPLSVRGVPVDATAANALEARTRALDQGKRAAWERLVEMLAPAADQDRLRRYDIARIDPFVQSYEVAAERSSATRYSADMTVHFRPRETRAELLGASAASAGRLEVAAAFASLRDWIEIRRRLATVPQLQETEVLALSAGGARLALRSAGDAGQLAAALAQAGLDLAPAEGGWRLALRPAP